MTDQDAPSRRALFLRSFLVQGAWNPRDLQGTGMAWILGETFPDGEGPEPFNAHPYLSGVALGAISRARRDEALSREALSRFRAALRAPLGALGDGLVWAGWLPALLLLAICLLAVGLPLGLPAGWGVAGFLLVHNVLHLGLRRWGLDLGLDHGTHVGGALARSPLRSLGDRARQLAVVLAGAVAGAVAVLAARSLPVEGWGGGPSLAAGTFLLVGLGYLIAGRLPVTTPLRVALLLLAGGWLVAELGRGAG
jgi:mannose/fructose/N-acetylgalactosamine-specific phosphotransferase system component IID